MRLDYGGRGEMKNRHLWGIVLAGGEGKRLRGFIRALRGRELPKQYCAIVGTRSMLTHTIDRARLVFEPDRLVIVINEDHLAYAGDQLSGQPYENIVVQPCSRDTGPGLLLALILIHRRDPDAAIAVFPSDHFVLEEREFMDHIRYCFAFINTYREYLLMLGVEPKYAEPGYGWIEKGSSIFSHRGMGIYAVKRFWEKPGRSRARELMSEGCLWNTLVMVGWVKEFLRQFSASMPEIFGPLETIGKHLRTPEERSRLAEIFRTLPSVNLSRSLLERGPGPLAVMQVRGVYWSDWGEGERILHDVESLGLHAPTPGLSNGG